MSGKVNESGDVPKADRVAGGDARNTWISGSGVDLGYGRTAGEGPGKGVFTAPATHHKDSHPRRETVSVASGPTETSVTGTSHNSSRRRM